MWKSICTPNFDKLSKSTADNNYVLFWKTDGLIFVIGVSFCIGLPNFVTIKPPSAEL